MTNVEAMNKAQVIYDLLGDTQGRNCTYWGDGALHFYYSSSTYLNCRITPVEDKYRIKIYTPINRATTVVLYEVDNVKGSELYDTFHNAITYLDNEWKEWNKDVWKGSWWGYTKGKEIKYDDHGYIVSVS